jgi:hypothetical protein
MGARLFRALLAVATATVVLLSMTQGVAAARRWNLDTPAVPPGPNPVTLLRGVSCPSASSCTAVGGFATSDNPRTATLVERWNGTSWSIQGSPNPSDYNELWGVSCPSTTACVAVGFSETVGIGGNMPLAETWDGSSWTAQTVPLPAAATEGWLDGVSCATVTDCIAVGEYYGEAGPHNPFAAHWDGAAWTVQDTGAPTGYSRLYGVSCSSTTACTAVGNLGTIGGASSTLAQRWDGTVWTPQSTPNPVGVNDTRFQGASCPAASVCAAVGYSTTSFSDVGTPLAEQWDGTTWTMQPTPNLPHAGALRGVSCVSASECAAVGTDYSVIAERLDGANWKLQHVPDIVGATYSELNGVSCAAAGECMAVGDYIAGSSSWQPLVERYS